MSDEEAATDQAGDDSELSTGGEMKFPSVGQALSGLEKTNTVLEKLQTAGIFESSAVLEELRDFTQYGAKLNSLYTARMPWIMVNLPGGETKRVFDTQRVSAAVPTLITVIDCQLCVVRLLFTLRGALAVCARPSAAFRDVLAGDGV
jgi:hypothetical protein